MAMESSHSSSSSFSYGFSYHVFISFRGSDTRHGFTGNLYKALMDKGIHTFIDDNDLERGDEITTSLIKTIENSRIFIPVFSINYASSSFCLDELVHIINCFKEKSRSVLPIFYDVDPTDVRYQTGSYGEELTKHEERLQDDKERLKQWKLALNQAANWSGFHFSPGQGYEYKFIVEIVECISKKINRIPLHVADYPVGLQSQLQQVKLLLDEESHEKVHVVGLYSTGGMGKSTLAKAIYNFVADQFDGLCFLDNVRENSTPNSLKHLQEELLLKTTGLDIKLGSVSYGIPIIKERLQRKKILLILDDVDKPEQLQALTGERDWFGHGSRVIITTRDKHLLTSHEIKSTYEVKGLNEKDALELLRWMAFKNNTIHPSYEDILNRVVTYAFGLPLALEVVGSNLYRKDIQEWKSLLDEYERIPNKDIQEILLVSYNNLSEYQQNVFLDIACCFKGYCLKEVENILSAHYGFCMKYQIGLLVDKSLVKTNMFNYVALHNLIEIMGKEIVRKESVIELGERNRLWFYKDIVHVLTENTQLHEAGETAVCFPSIGDEMIPNWFEHQSKGRISFWFRNRIPSFAIFVYTKKEYEYISKYTVRLVNDDECIHPFPTSSSFWNRSNIHVNHTNVFERNLHKRINHVIFPSQIEEKRKLISKLNEAFLKNEWIQMKLELEVRHDFYSYDWRSVTKFGIHFLKEKNKMEDIKFSNPNRKRKLDEDLNTSLSLLHPLLKKHKFVEMEVFEKELIEQPQHRHSLASLLLNFFSVCLFCLLYPFVLEDYVSCFLFLILFTVSYYFSF